MVKEKLKNLPKKPGVYLFRDKQSKVLYVGKAKNLRNRVRSYFQESRLLDPRLRVMLKKTTDFDFIVTDSEVEALILESNLIKENKPRYNVNLKDDKSYPYIRITAEDYPQIFPTRNIIRDGSVYFGPYTNVKDMRDALTTLKRIFVIRSCKFNLNETTNKNKTVALCLDYYIKKCKGPCQGLQTKDDYTHMIKRVREFLQGKTAQLSEELKKEMLIQANDQNYEDAARVRDKIEALEKYRNSQKIVIPDLNDSDFFAMATEDDDACAVIFKIREGKVINRVHYYLSSVLHKDSKEILEYFVNQYYTRTDEIPRKLFLMEDIDHKEILKQWLNSRLGHSVGIQIPKSGEKKKLMEMCKKNARYLLDELKLQKMKAKDFVPHVLRSLQRDLRMSTPPRYIECFDISNIQGSDPVASMVCFIDGRPKKSEYRKYSIKSITSPDDFAMMREVVFRRYSRLLREKRDLPDLIVIDGGKGQLSSALSVLKELKIRDQSIIGLAKKFEEIFLPGISAAQMLPRSSSSLRLLQQIRDEAHRFAIIFHRKRRKKRTIASGLDQIPGVGPKRRNDLLRKFGSVKKIRDMDLEKLIEQGNLGKKIAHNVYNYFHPNKNIHN
jgi:excinuclease ABC subunit C